MELKQKGSEVNIGGLKHLMISMKWSTLTDFDLAATYEGKTGKQGLVCYGEQGDINAFPFIQLSREEGIGDTGEDNEETMRITKLGDMKYVWLLCWDYQKVQNGAPTCFKDSDLKLSIMDDKGTIHNVTLDTEELGNVALIATIDNSSPLETKLVNTSKVGTLKGLKNIQQLFDIINE